MSRHWLVSGLPWIAIALLVLVLGALQHRWLAEVVSSEQQRLSVIVHMTSRHVAGDFDRALSHVFLHFQPPGEAEDAREVDDFLIEAADSWRDATDHPGLVRALYSIQNSSQGTVRLRRLDPGSKQFTSCEWPVRLVGLRDWLEQPRQPHAPKGVDAMGDVPYPLLPSLPGLVIPLVQSRSNGEERSDENRGDDFDAHVADFLSSVVVVELDVEDLRSHLLPELLDRYRLGLDSGYVAKIIVRGTDEVIFSSPPDIAVPEEIAARAPIFALRPLAELRAMLVESRARAISRQESASLNLAAVVTAVTGDQSGWLLEVAHSDGSLAAVVAKNQRRHLWVVGGVLAVLLLALASIQLSNRRAQTLARQRLELVAGVSHEFKTPLAAIKSLTQNLSRGIVENPEKVQTYGAMIEREQARLSDMVEQVLAFAGALSFAGGEPDRPALDLQPADLSEIVRAAVTASDSMAAEVGKEVEVETPDRPVQVLAEPESLGRAVQNLVANAIKYGGDGRRIRVRVGADEATGVGRASVEDDGPGIASDDLPHLFEPFYRGSVARSSQRPGSGLGLSLVRQVAEAHGGRAFVASGRGEGTTFTIEMPLSSGHRR